MRKKRIIYFDILNIFAAFSVIFLHCNGLAHTYSDTLSWKQAFAVETLFYWAVPVFLMLSGATLFDYRERYSTKEFFRKRFIRTVIPFILWSLIVATEKHIFPWDIGFRTFISRILSSEIENVYWFFPYIFTVYLCIPVFSLLKNNRKILWYLAATGLIVNSIIPSVCSYIGISWNYGLLLPLSSGVLLFPIIGYLFATTDFNKRQRIIIYLLGLFGALLRYFGTWYLSAKNNGILDKTFFGYYSYFSVFLACAVFTFFKYFKPIARLQKSEKAEKIISAISGCSLGIYLIHMIVYRHLSLFLKTNCWQWRLIVPFLIYLISLTFVYIIKKIPLIKHIFP